MLEFIQRKVYVQKANGSENGTTDGDTDVSSDVGHDRDPSDRDQSENFDFDEYDEIEASVERGMIGFDNERLAILEKRQAYMMADNEHIKKVITETIQQNQSMMKSMDCILDSAVLNTHRVQQGLPCVLPEPTDELVSALTTLCHIECPLSRKKKIKVE